MADTFRGALRLPGRIDGIDVSMVQGRIDWRRVADAGFRFVVVKASEGVAYCDPRAAEYMAGAREAGLVVMAYAFARPSQGRPAEQAARLWACSGDVMPSLVALDLESAPDDWSGDRIVSFAEAWLDAWAAYSAVRPLVYTYPDFARRRGGSALASSERLGACPLWIASYRSTSVAWAPTALQAPPVPLPWTTWAMWQYSGDGGYRVPGVPGDCDRNLLRGDERDLAALCGLVSPLADTVPDLPVVEDSGRPVYAMPDTVTPAQRRDE